MSKVSIQIVTYNSAATIATCLESLRAQHFQDFETCIIDNASSDDTVAKVRVCGFEIIINPANIGYAAAHNQALRQTQGEYVLTLNPDVRLEPGFIQQMVDALDRMPAAGSAAGCLLRTESLHEPPYQVDSAGLMMQRSRRQRLRDEGLPVTARPTESRPIFGPDGAAAFYRRAMLDDIAVEGKIFDEFFFMHKEDVDVCWRAQLRGWESVYVPGAIAHHIRHFRPGQRRYVADDLRFYSLRNRYLLMLKNDIPRHFVRDLWRIAPYDLGILLYSLIFERASLRAYADLWKHRGIIVQKRRAVQSRRRVGWREIAKYFAM